MQQKYTTLRALSRVITIYRLTLLLLTAASLCCFGVAFFIEDQASIRNAFVVAFISGVVMERLYEAATMRQSFFNSELYVENAAPAGIYFTGSLYHTPEKNYRIAGARRSLFGNGYGTPIIDSFTHLTDQPYPDGQALGCNGVWKRSNGEVWMANLICVNGRIHATPVCRAFYGWQWFVKYRCAN